MFEFGNELIPRRFWENVTVNNQSGCWEWTAGTFSTGYAYFWLDGRGVPGHRITYRTFKGEIPKGYHVDHLCRVRRCVNPLHLEAVTPRENNDRGDSLTAANARKQNCPKCGSEYTVTHSGDARYCKPCRTKWHQLSREQRRAAGLSIKDTMSPEAYQRRLESIRKSCKKHHDRKRALAQQD